MPTLNMFIIYVQVDTIPVSLSVQILTHMQRSSCVSPNMYVSWYSRYIYLIDWVTYMLYCVLSIAVLWDMCVSVSKTISTALSKVYSMLIVLYTLQVLP